MTQQALLVRVQLHAPRFHGRPEWPPSPGRLYQAIVAGASRRLSDPVVQDALRWLEQQPAPWIAVPRSVEGKPVTLYVPNNDLDTKQGDPGRVPELRVAKTVQPRLLDHDLLLYAWWFDAAERTRADTVASLADGVYQLGRGVDMAYARAEVVTANDLYAVWSDYGGKRFLPSPGATGGALSCPREGTFDSLEVRHAAQGERFGGRGSSSVFIRAPKALFREVSYGASAARFVFELRPGGSLGGFAPVALPDAHTFVVRCRDAAAKRLRDVGAEADLVSGVLVGRRPGDPERVARELRVRLVPMPSTGHVHTDPRIRRLLVEVPLGGPLPVGDIQWAFSGLTIDGAELVETTDVAMLRHYVGPARRWRSVTPLALPASRRRIPPEHRNEASKPASEREDEESSAIEAVRQALRHASVQARPVNVDVRREPFVPHGARAEEFAQPPRFPKERLWHVEITFDQALEGPLVLGDGRFLGLGIMQPSAEVPHRFAWRVLDGFAPGVHPVAVAEHLRRAVLARAQAVWGARARLPDWVTGHRDDGAPADGHMHLSYLVDPPRQRLLVIDPRHRDSRLGSALEGLIDLRAGRAGRLTLEVVPIDDDDPLLAPSTAWRTVTPYRVNRHLRRESASAAVEDDVRASCQAQGLPAPSDVRVGATVAMRGVGLEASVELDFAVAVPGPLSLGRTRHLGGGLFEHAQRT